MTCAWKQKGRQAGLSSVGSGKGKNKNVGLGPRRERNERKERGKRRKRGPVRALLEVESGTLGSTLLRSSFHT